jgi:hypothetical protein
MAAGQPLAGNGVVPLHVTTAMEIVMSANPGEVKSNATPPWRARLMGAAVALVTVALGACGGSGTASMSSGGGGASACTSGCGAAYLTIQDAAGDFQSYTVDVVALKLQKASGALVETLPATARVDFAQLVDLSELVSAGQIPAGEYVAATLTVDYSNASISAEDGNGGTVALTPQDSNGNALSGQLDLTVHLDNRHHLVITAGRTARLAFDFNLGVSNVVDLANGTVRVSPLIQASVVPPADLAIRVRGGLVSADTTASSYTVNVHPFHLAAADLGQLVVHTMSTTSFEIDGTAYTGAAGLAKLAMAPAGTITAAFGTLQTSDYTFTARRVLAGTSVESRQSDRVRGDVIARSGNLLTVRGATLDRRDGSFEFLRGDVTVQVADTTRVIEEGQAGPFGLADISVGQRVNALGTVSIDGSTGAATLDATAGRVRLEITPMWGLVTGAVGNPLTLDLQAIDGRDISHYNFAGTGASPATDANPAAYAVDTGTLDLGALTAGAPARVFGFPLPFGTATTTDFGAQSLVSYAQVSSQLIVNWANGGSAVAFPGLSAIATTLDLDLAGTGLLHFVQQGPARTNLLDLASPPQIVADTMASATLYSLGHARARTVDNYFAFADFIAALAADLNGTTTALGITATGAYDANTNAFTATHVAVLLND